MKSIRFLLLCFFLLPFLGWSQCTIQGFVFNKSDKTEIAGATVLLYQQGDTIPVKATSTNDKGYYQITGVKTGTYRLVARQVGMGKTRNKLFSLTNCIEPFKADTLFFESEGKELNEVKVETIRPIMTVQGDKKVFFIENNMAATGGTAADVMQAIPLVNVSPEGNLSLRGGENVTVWINGKPSLMGGGNQNTLLNMISAGNIEKVEIIANPSAKYDADNNNGIINIVLKENKQEKLNGSLALSWLVYNKANANLNLGFRNKVVNFNSSVFINYNPRFSRGSSYREQFLSADTSFVIDQKVFGNNNNLNYGARIGTEFFATKYDVVSLSANVTLQNQTKTEDNFYKMFKTGDASPVNWWRNSIGVEDEYTIGAGLGYRKNFGKPTHDLIFDFTYSYNNRKNEYDYADLFASDSVIFNKDFSRSNGPSINHNLIGMIDYVHPLKENEKVETGVKINYRFVDTDFDFFNESNSIEVKDSQNSFTMNYKELVNAAYFNYNNAIKNFTYQFGLRAEYALFTGTYSNVTSASVSNNFFNLFPSAYVTYKIGKIHELQAGYSLKIRRPFIGELIPFTDLSDPQNIRKGNPLLKPELIHNVEAAYLVSAKNQFFSIGAYYKHIKNNLTRIRTVEADGRSTIQSINQDFVWNLGTELILKNQIFKWWETSVNFNMSYSSINAAIISPGLKNSGITWFVKGNTTFRFWKDMAIQISADYNSPRPITQGKFLSNWGMDASVRKDFLNKTLSVSFNVRDIFFTRRFGVDISNDSFNQQVVRQRESRVYTFSLSYKFGKSEAPGNRRGKGNRPEGMDDGGGGDFF